MARETLEKPKPSFKIVRFQFDTGGIETGMKKRRAILNRDEPTKHGGIAGPGVSAREPWEMYLIVPQLMSASWCERVIIKSIPRNREMTLKKKLERMPCLEFLLKDI